ncbi:hypothetical protein B0T14DRAFT_528788 [Immersiella caudata]|uniref:Uncharacterized protein n=1 Tax=Immersiella caudata TaxID=314043 RepID=A0AA39WFU7_9PEZI|nr:hypothetical protein B0T14DRAFT_528788 [Immersiella caudata]
MSTINIVRYYFHKANVPATEERMRQLIALAYQTARDKQLYPKAIFVRYVKYSPSKSAPMNIRANKL